jgi:hypothetical protein|tara:strand:- start:10532 stop:10750 length:219 start_codon:yes stop_codon:yes gene_type:complete
MDFIMDKFYEDTYDKVSNYLKATNLASCKNCTAVITNEVIELWNEQGPIYVDIQEVIEHIINVKLLKKELCI